MSEPISAVAVGEWGCSVQGDTREAMEWKIPVQSP